MIGIACIVVNYELKSLDRNTATLHFSGDWVIGSGISPVTSVLSGLDSSAPPASLKLDLSALGKWDSSLVALLVQIKTTCEKSSIELELHSAPRGVSQLFALAGAVPDRGGAGRERTDPGFVESVGRNVIQGVKGGEEATTFLGEGVIALGKAIRGRAHFRMADLLLVLHQCGPQALPIVTLISFLVGMILAFVGIVQLEQFGAEVYVANLVTIAMVREMGGMMTGIIMAGRTGAAFAAQIGTMNVNDEIAALRTFGIPPTEFLVLPRVVGLILCVPLLTIYANVVGVLGGSAVTAVLSDVSFVQYYVQSSQSVDIGDWLGGLFKATIYGIIVAIAGCLRGLQGKKSAAAVGNAATSAVVTAIVFIIIAEAILTVVYTILGI